ncbi:MAG TPA: hypothetical protein VML75_17940, partial [Kofleriaceae bacterium]|nr:hypothetical protein [Kofleriaceae bacterium]
MIGDLPTIEAEIDQLYRRPLGEFIAARNELHASLRTTDPEAAARVKGLAKPTVSAWAVNQLYWDARPLYQALIAAGAALHAMTGGDADGLRAAMATRRRALDEALRCAEGVLERGGHATGMTIRRRVSLTLDALAAYGGGDDAPRAGRLTGDVDPPALDQLALLAAAAAVPATTPPEPGTPAPERRAPEPDRRDLQRDAARVRAGEALAEADAELQVLTHEARRAREARADTAERLAALEGRVEEARARLVELED